MAEITVNAERVEQLVDVFGSFDENIKRIEQELNVRIINRGTELKVTGDPEEADRGAMGPLEHFAAFYAHQNGRAPTEAQLDEIREIQREGGENL